MAAWVADGDQGPRGDRNTLGHYRSSWFRWLFRSLWPTMVPPSPRSSGRVERTNKNENVFVFFFSLFIFFLSQSEHVQKGSQKMYLAFLKAQIAKRNCKVNILARTYPVYLQTYTDRSLSKSPFLTSTPVSKHSPNHSWHLQCFCFGLNYCRNGVLQTKCAFCRFPQESINNLSINPFSIRLCYNQAKGNTLYIGWRRLANQRAPAILIV